MKFTDYLKLKLHGHKSVDTIIGIAQRNGLNAVPLSLENHVECSPGGMFSANVAVVYAFLEGHRAKMYTSDLMSRAGPGTSRDQLLVLENLVKIGEKIKERGITPTIVEYKGTFDQFVVEYQNPFSQKKLYNSSPPDIN